MSSEVIIAILATAFILGGVVALVYYPKIRKTTKGRGIAGGVIATGVALVAFLFRKNSSEQHRTPDPLPAPRLPHVTTIEIPVSAHAKELKNEIDQAEKTGTMDCVTDLDACVLAYEQRTSDRAADE